MKLITDEHVSPKIARAIREIALEKTWTIETIIGNESYAGQEDEDWVSLFARAGGRGFVSADRKMLKRATLLEKITQTGLVAVCLPSEWAEAKRQYQAAHVLY